jgi:hypothetical protein
MASRFVDLALQHDLIPLKQMAFVGRSTTAALQSLLDSIYSAWSAEETLQCTLLCLDISGAYDHVPPARLLAILASKGIPDWLLRFVRSWLYGRKSTLHIHGGSLGEFWVNITSSSTALSFLKRDHGYHVPT